MSSLAQQKLHQLITSAGAALLVFCLLCNAYFVWRNVNLHRETHTKAVRLQQIEAQVRDWQQLFQDLAAYSARQPAIDPILQKYGIQGASTSSKPR